MPPERLPRRVGLRRGEDPVDDVRGEIVGDEDLLGEPTEDQGEGPPRIHGTRVPRREELRQKVGGARDGTGEQIRKEGHVDGEVEGRRGGQLTAIDVDHVREHAEDEERDAHRQDDLQQRQRSPEPECREHPIEIHGEEVEVLEGAQRRDIDDDREGEPAPRRPGAAPRPGPRDLHAESLIEDRRSHEEQHEAPVPPAVEHVAGDDDHHLPEAQARHEQPTRGVHHEEEDGECDRGKEHAADLGPRSAAPCWGATQRR